MCRAQARHERLREERATALFELARDAKAIEKVEASLATLRAALDESDDLKRLTTSPLVSRGDAVTIAVTGQGFTVSQGGEALESGAEGAWIKVRGAGQGAQVLRGRVLRPGLVGIDLP